MLRGEQEAALWARGSFIQEEKKACLRAGAMQPPLPPLPLPPQLIVGETMALRQKAPADGADAFGTPTHAQPQLDADSIDRAIIIDSKW